MVRSRDRVATGVGVVVAFAIVARLAGLGSRPLHWDEARVGYWTLRYAETGIYEYRPVAGGPVLYLVGRWTLSLFPVSDALARLPVALVGGFLPAAALLFRDRLRADEVVGVATALAFTPLLVYYGRFLRADVVGAAAALVALGFIVRWIDGDEDRDLYLAAAAVAVAFATTGFVVATLVIVAAAAVLTFDHRRVAGEGTTAASAAVAGGRWTIDRATPLARAMFVFLGAWAVLFSPRGWGLLTDPVEWASRIYWSPVEAFLAVRVSGRVGTEFLPFVTDAVGVLLSTAGPLFLVALAGFVADRYGLCGHDHRPLVAFASFWAGLGLIGYPVVAEVLAPWTLVHALVPMAIPAGVGLALLVRRGRAALDRDDAARAAAVLLVLLAVGVHAGVVLADDTYGQQHQHGFAQAAQPADDLEPLVDEMNAALSDAADDRVVYVGDRFYLADESVTDHPPIPPGADQEAWGERLPLPWYVERTGATTDSVGDPADLDGEPAVVIADPADADVLADDLAGYETREIRLALRDREVVVFVRS